MRFGVCKNEYWYFDCVDLYIELLILLNCNFIGACRPCTYILKWIIKILIEKWDTVRFVDFEFALLLAISLKSFVSEPLIVRFYSRNMRFINDMCKKIKSSGWWDDCHLELLCYSDFFKNGDDDYLFLRKFILSCITNTNDIYHVNEFCDEDLFSRLACI